MPNSLVDLPLNAPVPQINGIQPTDIHLIWGRKEDRGDNRFLSRVAVIDHLIARWTLPEWTAVDVSGGAGRWLSTLAPKFHHFTHLDLSPDALKVARNDHPEFTGVEFGVSDLLAGPRGPFSGRMWDVAFCLDTLLYRGKFVEIALRNIGRFVRPGGIAIIDLPLRFRASVARSIKGRRYGGPERTFSPREAAVLCDDAGYALLATAYQYRELTPATHRRLAAHALTGYVPWPGTWMYLVLRRPEQQ